MSKLHPDDLAGFTGSVNFYRHSLFQNCLLTDGAAHVCEQGASWLLDVVCSWQGHPAVSPQDFQCWKLRRWRDRCVIRATDGNGHLLISQRIPFTDFPEVRFSLWACRNELGGVTVMLPSEY